jgi:beta-glucosidase
LNVGHAGYDPQFAYGFGLRYASPSHTTTLPEVAETTRYGERNVYYTKGTAWNGYKLSIGDIDTPHVDHVGSRTILNGSTGLMLESQGDGALHAAWNGASKAWLQMGADKPSDISREANGAMMLALTVRITRLPLPRCGWASVPLRCR